MKKNSTIKLRYWVMLLIILAFLSGVNSLGCTLVPQAVLPQVNEVNLPNIQMAPLPKPPSFTQEEGRATPKSVWEKWFNYVVDVRVAHEQDEIANQGWHKWADTIFGGKKK